MKRAKKAAPDSLGAGASKGRSNRGLWVMLAGLVAGGVVGWWRWLRSVRKY